MLKFTTFSGVPDRPKMPGFPGLVFDLFSIVVTCDTTCLSIGFFANTTGFELRIMLGDNAPPDDDVLANMTGTLADPLLILLLVFVANFPADCCKSTV